MDPYYLSNEELEYEYRLRNTDRQDYSRIRQIRSILADQIKAGVRPADNIEGLDPATELNNCVNIARELVIKVNKSRVHIPRLKTKWEHLRGRLNRINDNNIRQTQDYQEVQATIDSLKPKLEGVLGSQEETNNLEQSVSDIIDYLEDSEMAFVHNGNTPIQGGKSDETLSSNQNNPMNTDVPNPNMSLASNGGSRTHSTPSSKSRSRNNVTLLQGPPMNSQAFRDWNPIASTQTHNGPVRMDYANNINRNPAEVYRVLPQSNVEAEPNNNMGRTSDLFRVDIPESVDNGNRGSNMRFNSDLAGASRPFMRQQPPNYDQSEETQALRNQVTAMQEQMRRLLSELPTPKEEARNNVDRASYSRNIARQDNANLQSNQGLRYTGAIPREQTQRGSRSNARPDPYQLCLDDVNLDSFEDDRESIQSIEEDNRPFLRPIFNLAKSWQLRFSGDDRSMNLEQFLHLVEAHARANGISHRVLFQNGLNFLQDPAREIYLAKMDELGNWEQYKNMLRGAFTAGNSQFNLRERIRATVQGPKEPFATFLAKMLNMMKGVTHPPMDEQEKVSIIKRNIRADLGSRLLTHEIHTLQRLEAMVMRVEKNIVEISGNYRAQYGRNGNSNGTNNPQTRQPTRNQIYNIGDHEDEQWIEEDYYSDDIPNEDEENFGDVNPVGDQRRDNNNRPQYSNAGPNRSGYGPNRNNNTNTGQGHNRPMNSGTNTGYSQRQTNPGQGQGGYVNNRPRVLYCWICKIEGHHTSTCKFNPRIVNAEAEAKDPTLVDNEDYNPVVEAWRGFRHTLGNKPPGEPMITKGQKQNSKITVPQKHSLGPNDQAQTKTIVTTPNKHNKHNPANNKDGIVDKSKRSLRDLGHQ